MNSNINVLINILILTTIIIIIFVVVADNAESGNLCLHSSLCNFSPLNSLIG